MVDYDAAVAAVQDPNADPILLAKVAYENPEFGANVAVNPRCYPGLKRWLAEFGDERVRQTLEQMGFTADAIGGPVVDQQAPEAEAPAESDVVYGQESTAETFAETSETAQQTDTQPAADAWTDDGQSAESQSAYDGYADLQSVSDQPAESYAETYGTTADQPAGVQPADQPAAGYAQPAAETYAQPVQQTVQPQPVFEEPVVTNPYGFTVQLALTTTDQMQIAQIAQYAPELRVCIARNPNTYPALLDWLAQLGDPAINAALASRQ
ncbi:hypothetical protein [Bifidobacterium sp. SO4]|uniref:variant leucine-rich repeat-containing protein n=1 Tax=Bifidobacterium sp. SO4 TaxID=2809030 RepID=UPI001BDCF02C|nr:hypothetical protein [Bifidobacterium sp. SO4]MBT1171395.1 hypothetical protein [Bifidobacterium sp. SO4]